jgi:hypothetical protein
MGWMNTFEKQVGIISVTCSLHCHLQNLTSGEEKNGDWDTDKDSMSSVN